MRVKVKADAVRLYWGSLPGMREPQWVPAWTDWVFRHALEKIAGQWLPMIEGIERGVEDCVYVPLPGGKKDHYRYESAQMALPCAYIEVTDEGDGARPVTSASSPQAWWSQEGLTVVRLLTTWVDGFMAFTRSARTELPALE